MTAGNRLSYVPIIARKEDPRQAGPPFYVYNFVELWYTVSHTGEGGDGYSPNLERGEVTGMTFSEVILLLNLLVTVVFGVLNLTLKK